MAVRVKICCIAGIDEARAALSAGAHLLGLVGAMPSGPGPIDDRTIAQVAQWCPPGATPVLLTSETTPDGVVDHVRRCAPGAVQLVDRVAAGTYQALRRMAPGVKILQVVHVTGPEAVEEAEVAAAEADAVLLDSGRPGAAMPELGGTGRTHDWSISRRIVARLPVPVFLAGGLRPDTVAEAIATVRRYGVDLCSGVRTNGRLDTEKLASFMAAVATAGGPAPTTASEA